MPKVNLMRFHVNPDGSRWESEGNHEWFVCEFEYEHEKELYYIMRCLAGLHYGVRVDGTFHEFITAKHINYFTYTSEEDFRLRKLAKSILDSL